MEERELAVITAYIMYNDLLDGTRYDGSFFNKIDNVMKLAVAFIKVYPHDYGWEEESFEETLEEWVANNYERILN
jgi:hypothetical protein